MRRRETWRWLLAAVLVPGCAMIAGLDLEGLHPASLDASAEGSDAQSDGGSAGTGIPEDSGTRADTSAAEPDADAGDVSSSETGPDHRDVQTGPDLGDGSPGAGDAQPANRPPVTGPEIRVTVVEGTQNNIVRLQATDADGDLLTYRIVKPPVKGNLTLVDAMRGEVKYASTFGFRGFDEFEYQVSDGHDDAPANGKVRVVVLAAGPDLVRSDLATGSVLGAGAEIDGETAILGSYYPPAHGGGAYIARRREDGAWEIVQRLSAEGDDPNVARFGEYVALDGDWALVAAWGDWDAAASPPGRAFFFKRDSNGMFHRAHTVDTPSLAQPDRFGIPVQMDADWAAIGVLDGTHLYSFAVYMYLRGDNDEWGPPIPIRSPEGATNDLFGSHFDLEGDTLVIGAPFDGEQGERAGAAHVYKLRNGSWQRTAKLLPPGALGEACWVVALSGDTVLCGAPKAFEERGAVHAFSLSTAGRSDLVAPASVVAPSGFGRFAAIDGDTAVVVTHGTSIENGLEGVAIAYRRVASEWEPLRDIRLGPVPQPDGGRPLPIKVAIDGTTVVATNIVLSGAGLFFNVALPGTD